MRELMTVDLRAVCVFKKFTIILCEIIVIYSRKCYNEMIVKIER